MLNHQPVHGIGRGPNGPFGALEPRLCLIKAPLVRKRHSEDQAGGAGHRIVAPAVFLGQLNRLLAAGDRHGERLEGLGCRQEGKAAELQERSLDPARQCDALLQMPHRRSVRMLRRRRISCTHRSATGA